MAGWSKSKNGSELKTSKIDQGYESNNVLCFDLDFTANDGGFDDCKDRLRSLFDQVIPIFLREVSVNKYVRPLPALLADGQPVDLFQLFCVVKKRGGFDTVSRKGLWGLVLEECELSVGLVASVKLIYIKYLKELDGWLRKVFRDKRSENGEIELFKKLDLLIVKSEELRDLVLSGMEERRSDLKSNATGSYFDIDMGKSESHLSDGGDSNKVLDQVESSMDDGKLELKFNEIGGYIDLDIGKSEFLLSDGGRDFNKLHDNVESSIADVKLDLKFNETGSYIDLDVGKSELLLTDGGGVFNKLHDNEDSDDDEKYFCIQGDKNIMLSAKCVVDKAINYQKIECCSGVEGDKVQDNIKISRIDDDEKLGVQDDYDILLSAKSVVDKVVSCKQSGTCSWAEGDNIVSANDDDENLTDDYDFLLSARSFIDQGGTSQKRELNTWGGRVINEAVDKIVSSRKRKRESISVSGMLNWLTQVAKHPDDPAIGVIPAPSKRKVHGVEEFWLLALLAREALLIKRPNDADSEDSSVQKKLKMHPSMYEDKNALRQSTDRVRCSKRSPLTKSHFCSCCNPGPTASSKLTSPHKAEVVNDSRIPAPTTLEVQNIHTTHDMSTDEPFVKQASVGPDFQADVPEWTGVILESDSKWLGIRMWPPEDGKNKTLAEMHPVGKGRQNSCDCLIPGSSGCVRFHIAEKRIKLKLELGPLFYRWRFDRMGEEVSLSWTTQEEKRFKIMVRQDSAVHNKFWNKAFRLFPTRTREVLVSYYFNVLVLRRRIYQNRVTPRNIDSDDDETEFGSVGDNTNNDGPNLPNCSMNMQCTDFE